MLASLPAALRRHWPEYAIEAAGLAAFMASALGFTVALEHPASALREAVPDALARRALMGVAMGATLAALVYNRFGMRSGAHFNPVFTFTFWRIGRVDTADAILYAVAQFAGAAIGVAVAGIALGAALGDAHVRWAATSPGPAGVAVAFAGEATIAFAQMSLVLAASGSKRWNRWTGVLAAIGVATYITVEAPLSGMSMNPARTLGSALGARDFTALWLYFAAPLLGMLSAAELYRRLAGARRVHCAKLHHANGERCIFRCGWAAAD